MAEKTVESKEFGFDVDWPVTPVGGGDRVLDASVGRLRISVDNTILTTYHSDKGDNGTELTMPLYNVAEWMANNWWSLLFEPRKNDPNDQSDDDFGFRSRHWLGFARDGFALPDLWVLPAGEQIEISATADTYLRFARVTFSEGINASLPTSEVSGELAGFVSGVLEKMSRAGISDTLAHEIWNRIKSTAGSEELYCRLVGSLGLSPYEENAPVSDLLDHLSDMLPESVLIDLCQASDEVTLPRVSSLVNKIRETLASASPIDIHSLADVPMPSDHTPYAWRWGKEAASVARREFGIDEIDPRGGSEFFERLSLNPAIAASPNEASAANRVSGALAREGSVIRVALPDQPIPQRRFATARAAFLGWSAHGDASRLVTNARTRDQQASRAFAAELLAPIKYIRGRIGGGNSVSSFRITDIAEELNVSSAVVKWQAQNNRIHILDSSNFM
jgi:hypothetical protein